VVAFGTIFKFAHLWLYNDSEKNRKKYKSQEAKE
jgi:hypothetical protein